MAGGDVGVGPHPGTALIQAVGVVGVVTTTPGSGGAGTSAITRIPVNLVNVTLLALNANRLGAAIINHATGTILFLKLGAVAVIGAGVESYTVLLVPNAYYEVPFGYTGVIDGIWDIADAAGEALITEVSA